MHFQTFEMTRHTSITVGHCSSALARHSEIPDYVVRKFWDQYAEVLGKGWWR